MKTNTSDCDDCLCCPVCEYKDDFSDMVKKLESTTCAEDWPFVVSVSCLMFKQDRGTVRR